MGAWIEIQPPKRQPFVKNVAPFMGAWIDMESLRYMPSLLAVVPFMGAWIEITWRLRLVRILTSLTFHGKKEC